MTLADVQAGQHESTVHAQRFFPLNEEADDSDIFDNITDVLLT